MHFYAFGSGKPFFQDGWRDEEVVSIFGSAKIDLTQAVPAADAALTGLTIFGGMTVIVPAGSRVQIGGMSLFGGREIHVTPGGNGPTIQMTLSSLFGGIKVREAAVPAGRLD